MCLLLQGPEGKLGPPGNRGRHGKKVRNSLNTTFSVQSQRTQSKALWHLNGSRERLSHLASAVESFGSNVKLLTQFLRRKTSNCSQD